MEDFSVESEFISDTIKDKLIIEGANEISRYGISNFSLRRVASACNISCAAPYKHFKNKEELILEIVRYINRQWELLCGQVLSLFENDPARQLTEICIAYVRFWVANPNYRSVLSASEKEMRISEHSTSVEDLIRQYCQSQGNDLDETERTVCALKAILYGMTALMENGEIPNVPKTYDYIRLTVEKELI